MRQSPWQLQDAEARFSEVFRMALAQGPQRITRHGKEGVVVIADEEYQRLVRSRVRKGTLAEFLAKSPLAGSGICLDREADYGRAVKL